MGDTLTALYPWIKSLHIISVIAWMSGLLYLPRLFVYHAQAPIGSERSEMLKVMERRLLRIIMNPAMIATLLFGGLLLATPGMIARGVYWWHAKLLLVIALAVVHMFMGVWRKDFSSASNSLRSSAR